MGSRHKGREAAMKAMYQSDLLGEEIDLAVESVNSEKKLDGEELLFAKSLAFGATRHIGEIDEKVKTAIENWDLERIGFMERAILRLAMYEMLFDKKTDAKVVIDEAVELAKSYCDPKSSGFINGVLDRLMKENKE